MTTGRTDAGRDNNATPAVRYGIAGVSSIARKCHVPSFYGTRNARLVAVASRSASRARSLAAEHGIPLSFGTYADMLAAPEVDAVIVTLPNSLHAEWTVRAAESGKHVLCEKPLATSAAEAEAMIAAARHNGVVLMEGFTHRFLPQMDFVLGAVRHGTVGETVCVRTELTYTLKDWERDSRARAELAGGALMDAGCYCVNTVRFLMEGEPDEVHGYARMRNGVDATFSGVMRFGERTAIVHASMEEPFRACCEVSGTRGRILVPDLFFGTEVLVVSDGRENTHRFSPVDRFRCQLEHFSRCVHRGATPRVTVDDSLGNARVLAVLSSAAGLQHCGEHPARRAA